MRGLRALIVVGLVAVAGMGCAPPGSAPVGTGTFPPTTLPPTPTPTETVPATPSCGTEPILVTAGRPDAGLGHRGLVLLLTNCGRKPYAINGYPSVRVLDERQAVMPVRVRHGTSYFGRDPGPKPITVPPGGTAKAVLGWSATVTEGKPETGTFLKVAATEGDKTAVYPIRMDLGTTGEVVLTAWARDLLN